MGAQDMTPIDDQAGFAPDDDAPIPYMTRTREYYAAIGYTTAYRWAHYVDACFRALKKPLAKSRVTIVTTAAKYDPTKGDQGPGAAYNGSAKFYQVYDGDTARQHDLRISHIGYDRKHTTATDSGTWFPLPQLLKAAAAGRIGEVAPRFFGAPTNRSHRVTIEVDAPEILARCLADKVDVAVLVPNCPVCHQTAALEARLQQHFPDEPGRTGAAPQRIRQAKRDRARQPGGLTAAAPQQEEYPSGGTSA